MERNKLPSSFLQLSLEIPDILDGAELPEHTLHLCLECPLLPSLSSQLHCHFRCEAVTCCLPRAIEAPLLPNSHCTSKNQVQHGLCGLWQGLWHGLGLNHLSIPGARKRAGHTFNNVRSMGEAKKCMIIIQGWGSFPSFCSKYTMIRWKNTQREYTIRWGWVSVPAGVTDIEPRRAPGRQEESLCGKSWEEIFPSPTGVQFKTSISTSN